MQPKHTPFVVLFAFAVAGCGGSKVPAESPGGEAKASDAPSESASSSDEAKSSARDDGGSTAIPKDCHKPSGLCLPDPKFVKKLCNNRYPSLAPYLFGNGSKWARGYL